MKQKTTAGGVGGGGAGLFVVWLLGHVGVQLGAEDGAMIASVAIAAGAYIGHVGVVGLVRRLIWGDGTS